MLGSSGYACLFHICCLFSALNEEPCLGTRYCPTPCPVCSVLPSELPFCYLCAAFLVVLHTWNVLCVHRFIFFDPFYFIKYLSHILVLLPQAYLLPMYEGHSGNSSVLRRICKDTWPVSHCFLNRLFLFDICSYLHKV